MGKPLIILVIGRVSLNEFNRGPGAAEAAKKLLPGDFDLTKMAFMTGVDTTVDGIQGCRLTR